MLYWFPTGHSDQSHWEIYRSNTIFTGRGLSDRCQFRPLLSKFLSCPAHFRKQFSEENRWNHLNNWKNHPCSFFFKDFVAFLGWWVDIIYESFSHHTWIIFKLKFTFIFSSCAANDFSKSSCFLMRASTLSSESPRSLLARKACNR